MHGVLGAIGGRLDVRAGAANRIAGSQNQASANQHNRHQLLNHDRTSVKRAERSRAYERQIVYRLNGVSNGRR
jgi:hypothetical protein